MYVVLVLYQKPELLLFFSESLKDEMISAIDLVNDLVDSRYPYLSYIDYHCGSEGMTFYLKAELSLIKNKNIPKDFNFAEVKNADIFRNFTNFPAPSEDDTFNAKYSSQHMLTTIPFLWI